MGRLAKTNVLGGQRDEELSALLIVWVGERPVGPVGNPFLRVTILWLPLVMMMVASSPVRPVMMIGFCNPRCTEGEGDEKRSEDSLHFVVDVLLLVIVYFRLLWFDDVVSFAF